MKSIRNVTVITLGVTVSLLAGSLLTEQRASADDQKKGARAFYLTKTQHTGDQALNACAAGFHMASLWEILDPSNFRYDTTLGFVNVDSGSGPPTAFGGWIRTGVGSNVDGNAGGANCGAWSSSNASHSGTAVSLPLGWSSTSQLELRPVHPWQAVTFSCDTQGGVWCVED